ncbi:uncharacterized protein LOC126847563 isoform X1 [Adelges cooleyi]|uniref:uncharacterized protein LOC126847563 isoform X1 n=1 Tax=Adelges cooleyi TaxID=133065 RepID=UPI0021800CA0|nr:uncharacterized protein LOC126847563 isoform X1 [Adelges cooleyi]
MEKKLDDLIKTVTAVKRSNGKIISSINSRMEKFNRLDKRFDDLFKNFSVVMEENRNLKLKIVNIEERLLSVENNKRSSSEHDAMEELMDRQVRSNNIILFNLPENDNESDLENIEHILTDLNENIEHFTFARLGRIKSTDRPRPVKIRLAHQSDVFTILRAQKRLKKSTKWSNIHFSSDKPTKRRGETANLRKTLQDRREKGISSGRTPCGYTTSTIRSPYNNKLTVQRDQLVPTSNRRDVNLNDTQQLQVRDTNPGPNPATQPKEPTPTAQDQLLDIPKAPQKGQGFGGFMDESFVKDTEEDTSKAVNLYQNKKLLSQGMMDVALFSANANQLRYVIESGGGVLSCICIGLLLASISLQILVGIALHLSVRYNVTNCEQRKLAFRFGNYVIVGIFLITALNVFITAFGGPSPAAPVVPIMGRMGDSLETVVASTTVQPGELPK